MNRSKIILTIFFLLLAGTLGAQVTQAWVARYNGMGNGTDYGRAVGADPSGNVYTTGYSYNGSNYDIVTVKYNSSGVQQWAVTYNSPYNSTDYPYAIYVDASGNVYVAGYTYNTSGNVDMLTLKYNTSGTLQWNRLFNGSSNSSDYGYDITVDASGNVYTAGYAYNINNSVSSPDMEVVKYNSAGTLQWARAYNDPNNSSDYGRAVAVDGSGNVYIAGYGYYNNTSYPDALIAKFNSAGVFQWVGVYATSLNYSDYGYDVAVDGSGNVYLGGYSYITSTSNADFIIVKYNTSGTQLWMRNWNGPQNYYDYGYYIKCNTAGDVWMAGYGYYSSSSSYDLELVKYNASGTFQWAANYNGTYGTYDYMTTPGNMLAIDASDNAYICGYGYVSSGSYYDYETVKFNSAGVQQWAMTYNGPGAQSDYAYWVAVDASNNVYTTGYSYGSGTGYDFATIKYTQGTPVTRQPDSWVKNSAEANPGGYIGDNIYEYPTPSASQTKAQTVNPGSTGIYHIRLTNDGTASDSFRITGPSAPGNWTYTYYDALTGGNNITAAVTGSGWNSGAIATTAYREIRVEVTPAASVAGGTTQNVDVTSTSINDGTKRDVVRASTTTTSANQPDNHIKLSSEAATLYVGDNVYNLDGTNQTKTMQVDPLQVASYTVRIQNDGNASDNMTVTGTAGNTNFTVAYYDAATGGNNITSSVTGSGWTTGSLAVGATREIRLEVTPAASATPGSTYDVLVTSRSGLDANKRDAVSASTNVLNHRPDNHIKLFSEASSAYVGDNVYNLDGTNQTKSLTTNAGSPAVYHIRIQNDGNVAEAYTITGTGNGTTAHASWTVRYYDALTGGNEITSSVTGAGWSTGSLAIGATKEIRVEVTANAAAWGFESYPVLVISTAPGYGSVKDAVRATTTVRDFYQPDNLVKRADNTTYTGDGIYNADGTDQTASYISNFWDTKVFHVRIENDSNTVDTYNVTGTGDGGSGWTVKYYDALTGGADITFQVTGDGWSTGSLDPDGFREIRVEITGLSGADSMYEVLVTSTSTLSTHDPEELDAIKCVVVTASAQPDILVRNYYETDYSGDNIYNKTGMSQTREQVFRQPAKAIFQFEIQNDYLDPEGNPDVFIVKGTPSTSTWKVQYFDRLDGGNDITSAMTASGWSTGELVPLDIKHIRAEVVCDTTLSDSSVFEILVKLTSVNDGNRQDVAKGISIYRKESGVNERIWPKTYSLSAEPGKVQYSLAKASNVSVKVFDAAGNLVAILDSGVRNAGSYTLNWKAPTSGVYFVKVTTPEYSAVRKVMIIK